MRVEAKEVYIGMTGLLSESDYDVDEGVALGIIVKDKLKYVIEYDGNYYPAISHTYDGEVDKVTVYEFDTEKTTSKEALEKAVKVEKGNYIKLSYKIFEAKDSKELNQKLENSKLHIYDENKEVKKYALNDFENKGVDFNDLFKDEDTKGKVVVKAEENHVTVNWELGKDNYPDYFKIEGTLVDKGLQGKSTDSYEFDFEGESGEYNYYFVDTNGNSYEGKVFLSVEDKGDGTSPITSTKKPKVRIIGIPDSIEEGSTFELTIKTDIDSYIEFNGQVTGLTSSASFTIKENGVYKYSVESEAGKMVEGEKSITCFVKRKGNDIGKDPWDGDDKGDNEDPAPKPTPAPTGVYEKESTFNPLYPIAIVLIIGVVAIILVRRKKNEKN